MLSKRASTMVVFGFMIGFFIFAVIVNGLNRTTKSEKITKTEKIVETGTLYSKGNVWVYSGPGKDYSGVAVLYMLQEVTVEKSSMSNDWVKLTSPYRGYAYYKFFYTVKQAESILLRKLK